MLRQTDSYRTSYLNLLPESRLDNRKPYPLVKRSRCSGFECLLAVMLNYSLGIGVSIRGVHAHRIDTFARDEVGDAVNDLVLSPD